TWLNADATLVSERRFPWRQGAKDTAEGSEANSRSIRQFLAAADGLAVDRSTVLAAKIFDLDTFAADPNDRMLSGNRWCRNHDRCVRCASNEIFSLAKRVCAATNQDDKGGIDVFLRRAQRCGKYVAESVFCLHDRFVPVPDCGANLGDHVVQIRQLDKR